MSCVGRNSEATNYLDLFEVPRNRMREIFTYGSVGGAGGNPVFLPGSAWALAGPTLKCGVVRIIKVKIFLASCLKRN